MDIDAPSPGAGSFDDDPAASRASQSADAAALKASAEARKMEALGRSFGGLAHDFNNLLTVIAGNGRLLLERVGPDSPLRPELEQLLSGSAQAAELTAQLMTFSRQAPEAPRSPLDVSSVLRGMERMLRGAVGEEIQLCLKLDAALPAIMATPAEIQHLALNLALTGRDFLTAGGRLEMETSYVRVHERDAAPGEGRFGGYVRLKVRSTGDEMDEQQNRAHSRHAGHSAGRDGPGLAVARAAVSELGGSLAVEDERGAGTAMVAHLPVTSAPASRVRKPRPAAGDPACIETLLVVEDDAGVRTLTRRILGRLGYTVMEAGNGAEALRVLQSSDSSVDLLIADVVMPVLGGVELGRRLREDRPGMRVLYMSGYPDDVVELEETSAFIKKPFTPDDLARQVRAVLDAAPHAAAR